MLVYIIDAKSDEKYFLVISCETGRNIKISKKCNNLEDIKKLIGTINIKEIIE